MNKDTLSIKITEKNEMKDLIYILSLGFVEAIKNNCMTFEKARKYFISPYTAQALEELNIDKETVNLIYSLCEIDDVMSIIPEQLVDILEQDKAMIMNKINSLKNNPTANKYWVDVT